MTLEEMIAMQRATTRKRPSDEEKLKGRLFAVPNGGKRDARTASKLKEEGVVAGVSDLILLVPNRFYGALLIEMKTTKGKQSKLQSEWEQTITSKGEYKYVVCHSMDEFISEINDYLKYYM